MAALRKDERAKISARRLLLKETRRAVEALDSVRSPTDNEIHEARKRLKKARAALRLMRKALGARVYRRENRVLRDAARPLSEVRDAKVLIETFDGLAKELSPAARRRLLPVRARLVAARTIVRRRILGKKGALRPLRAALQGVEERAKQWPTGSPWSVLGPGLRRAYRTGREAFALARAAPSIANLHEWRKQAKYLWHQLDFLKTSELSPLKQLIDQAHELSDRLGDDHDLAVLKRRLLQARARSSPTAWGPMDDQIDRRRKELEAKAMALGAKIYFQPPRGFVRRVEGYQRARLTQPARSAK